MKEGLTYISERTGQLRYADHSTQEQWIQQLPAFIPLGEIKRGQPVSVATQEDIEEFAGGSGTELASLLLSSTERFCVLTNPSRHTSCIGLSLEYSKITKENINQINDLPKKIHIINQGFYEEDNAYVENSQQFTKEESEIENTEYWPEFFNTYPDNIGKKVYVKAVSNPSLQTEKGQLTLSTDEVYLPGNNVIIIGYVADTVDTSSSNGKAGILVQLLGDDRTVVNHTQFDIPLGEDVNFNGEPRVFAIGNKTNASSLRFNFNCDNFSFTDKDFLGLQLKDGTTSILCQGTTWDKSLYNEPDDVAFINSISGVETVIDATNVNNAETLKGALTSALKDQGSSFEISQDPTSSIYEASVTGSNKYYDFYISKSLRSKYTNLGFEDHGGEANEGKAILADVRDPERQNIIGVFFPKKDSPYKAGEVITAYKQGKLSMPNKGTGQLGNVKYLGLNGLLVDAPQLAYNSVVEVGYFIDNNTFLANCTDSRQFLSGDLPIGYIKPMIGDNVEPGYLKMDGSTSYPKEDYKKLYERLCALYGSSKVDDGPDTFIIPLITYTDVTGTPQSAQIKYMAEGAYRDINYVPYYKYESELVSPGEINPIDISYLINSSPYEEESLVKTLETLDIKAYTDIKDTQGNIIDTYPVEEGFHIYNNMIAYGFKWKLKVVEEGVDPDKKKSWKLIPVYSDGKNKESLKACVQLDPYAPPVPIDNVRLHISKKPYLNARQLNISSLVNSIDKTAIETAVGEVLNSGIPKGVNDLRVNNSLEVGGKSSPATSININSSSINLKSNDLKLTNTSDNKGITWDGSNLKYTALPSTESGSLSTETIIPYSILQKHENSVITDPSITVHGIINSGVDGNINANTLLGTSLRDYQLKGITANKDISNSWIPLVEQDASRDNSLNTALGSKVHFYKDINSSSLLMTKSIEDSADSINETSTIKNEAKDIKKVYSNTSGTITEIFNLKSTKDEADILFKKGSTTEDFAALQAKTIQVESVIQNSSIKYKYLLQKFFRDGSDIFTKGYEYLGKDKSNDTAYPRLFGDNALQALGELPLASFKYNRNYETEGDTTKQYLGVIVEQVNDDRDKFGSSQQTYISPLMRRSFDYEYENPDNQENLTEQESIANYMNIVTDDSESAMNVMSTVGILLKAAKETQGRLLDLELSAYGETSPTFPGIKSDFRKNQKYIQLGSNTLSRKISNSIFLSEDSLDGKLSVIKNPENENISINGLTDFGNKEKFPISQDSINKLPSDFLEDCQITPVIFSAYYNSLINNNAISTITGGLEFSKLYEYINTVLTRNKLTPYEKSVKVATTEPLKDYSPSQIDGVTLSTGDLVLVKDQIIKSDNGLYKYASNNILEKRPIETGTGNYDKYFPILEGDTNKGKIFYQVSVVSKDTSKNTDIIFESLDNCLPYLEHGKGYGSVQQVGNTALGDYSHAEGENTLSLGHASHAEGGFIERTVSYKFINKIGNTVLKDSYDLNVITNSREFISWGEGLDFTNEAELNQAILENREILSDVIFYIHTKGLPNENPEYVSEELTSENIGEIFCGPGYLYTEMMSLKLYFIITEPQNSIDAGGGLFVQTSRVKLIGYKKDNVFTKADVLNSELIKLLAYVKSTSIGMYSHAEGISSAEGEVSHSEGIETISKGKASHTEGKNTEASGNYSHAEGSGVISYGSSSHAEGIGAFYNYIFNLDNPKPLIVKGNIIILDIDISYHYPLPIKGSILNIENSFYTVIATEEKESTSANYKIEVTLDREVEATEIKNISIAIGISYGDVSHSEGYFNTSSGLYSHSEGYLTLAMGDGSHSEGALTQANGFYSHAEGDSTVASGTASHAEGQYNAYKKYYENGRAEGTEGTMLCTDAATNGKTSLLIVGCGNGASGPSRPLVRKNALEVWDDGQVWIRNEEHNTTESEPEGILFSIATEDNINEIVV